MMMEERYIRRNEELDGIKELCIRDAGYVEVVIRGDRFGPLGPRLAATLVHRPLGVGGKMANLKTPIPHCPRCRGLRLRAINEW